MLRLLKSGVSPITIGAIYHAAERGSKAIVQALLDGGIFVDMPNPVGKAALYCVVRNGHGNVTTQLLENGADVNAKGGNHQTALYGAAE